MAQQRGRRRGRKKKSDSDFIRLTGLWKPEDRSKKQLAQGKVTVEGLEDVLAAIEDKGGNGAFIFLFKNEFAESSNDPRYILSVLPLDNRDEDEDEDEPRRRKRKPGGKKKRRTRREKEEDERDDDDDDDDEDEEDDDDDDEDPPF